MKQTDAAWAAGILDGEGYIGMTRCWPGTNRRRSIGYQLRISVRMTHRDTIWRLARIFDCGTLKQCRPQNVKRHKPAFEWFVSDRAMVLVLQQVLPYLTTKKDQALLALSYATSCSGDRGVVPRQLQRRRDQHFQRMTRLNRKGP